MTPLSALLWLAVVHPAIAVVVEVVRRMLVRTRVIVLRLSVDMVVVRIVVAITSLQLVPVETVVCRSLARRSLAVAVAIVVPMVIGPVRSRAAIGTRLILPRAATEIDERPSIPAVDGAVDAPTVLEVRLHAGVILVVVAPGRGGRVPPGVGLAVASVVDDLVGTTLPRILVRIGAGGDEHGDDDRDDEKELIHGRSPTPTCVGFWGTEDTERVSHLRDP